MHQIYIVLLENPVYGLLHSKFWKQKMYLNWFLKVIIFGLLLSWRRHSSSSNIIFYFDSICWNCQTLNWSLCLRYDEENWLWEVVPQKSIYITITLYWSNLHLEYSVFNLFFFFCFMFFSERKICSEIYIKSREYFTDDNLLFIVKTRPNAPG